VKISAGLARRLWISKGQKKAANVQTLAVDACILEGDTSA
jgi:hypothetical protein